MSQPARENVTWRKIAITLRRKSRRTRLESISLQMRAFIPMGWAAGPWELTTPELSDVRVHNLWRSFGGMVPRVQQPLDGSTYAIPGRQGSAKTAPQGARVLLNLLLHQSGLDIAPSEYIFAVVPSDKRGPILESNLMPLNTRYTSKMTMRPF